MSLRPSHAARAEMLSRHLGEAIANQRLTLMYQPKVRLDTGAFAGVEALVRWTHPALGPVSPAEFVPLAELSGRIDALTDWVMEAALRVWRDWREQGLDAPMSVNVSACNLGDASLPDRIGELCACYGMPPERLTLELTESATQSLVALMHNLTRLRLRGVGVSIDDFGTGYSSLAQLRALPFTELKIDQSFVRQLGASLDSEIIVRAIIDLAHNLGLNVVAEGAESEKTIERLRQLGSDMVQGYCISPPLDADALLRWSLEAPQRLRAR